jgi:xylan 1,4-beta-xylosidase
MIAESFHTQHAPLGSFSSFTVGLVGAPGGFGQALKGPAKQNVYTGYRNQGGVWQLLPFFIMPKSSAAAFLGEAEATGEASALDLHAIAPDAYTRKLGWASDSWVQEDFRFEISTPFEKVPEPKQLDRAAARYHFAPVVCATLSFDNSKGTAPVELMFGIGDAEVQMYPMSNHELGFSGFSGGDRFGFAAKTTPEMSIRQGFSIFAANPMDYRGIHLLGGETALVFTIPAGQKRSYPLALGFYQDGQVTTGIRTTYAYTRWFSSIEDVLAHGLANHDRYVAVARQRDAELEASKLDADQRFLVAQGTHSYYGSTELLFNAGELLWVVNEGEYRMINTFDLTIDHAFFEMDWLPWAVRDTLDLFADRYSYVDKVRSVDGREGPGGLAFTHDMGVSNHFTAPGHSSYECDNLHGCFSHMTMEQLLNWILTAITYSWKLGDWRWLESRRKELLLCLESLENRDDPDPAKRDGLLKWDSSRCVTGSEITTYDSLDVSLGQARNNLYLAVKALGACILMKKAFSKLDEDAASARAQAFVERINKTVAARFDVEAGCFPAVFEKGNRSHIIPAIEGFVYPLYLGMNDEIAACGPLLELLGRHMTAAFKRGVCLDATSGGWKMSSTSRNTWFSKIAISQYVARRLFPSSLNAEARAADRVHANWQRTPGCGAFAMCDQIFSDTGITCGSRYYPRGVTTYLWLQE